VGVGLFALLALTGCQTGAQYQANVEQDLSARLSQYDGATIAEFIAHTGMTPTDAYPVGGGRVFIFRGSTIVTTVPATNWTPAISNSAACQLLVQAVPISKGGTASDWKIIGTSRTGPCNTFPV
jgi:hypothetical protein